MNLNEKNKKILVKSGEDRGSSFIKNPVQEKKKSLKKISSPTQPPPTKTTAHKAELLGSKKSKAVKDPSPSISDGLSSYLQAIQKYPLLTKEEELKIARRYREGKDPKDAEILVTSNLRFVVRVAAEYSKFGAKLIDLIQEGNVGLMHAVKEYNPYKGARLITYAVWWIKGYIQDYLLKQHSLVRIGTTSNQRKLFYNLEREKAALDRLGHEPTVQLLSHRLGVPEKDVEIMEKRVNRRDISLDQPMEGNTRPLDFEPSKEPNPLDHLLEKESLEQLQKALERLKKTLSDKELFIIKKRLLSETPLKLQEIGNQWKVTREAVRQMENRLLKKIKKEILSAQN